MDISKLPKDEEGSLVLPADSQPKDGVFRNWDGAQHDQAMQEAGNDLGEMIDVDNDEDDGLDILGLEGAENV